MKMTQRPRSVLVIKRHGPWASTLVVAALGFCNSTLAGPSLSAYALSAGGASAFGSLGGFSCSTFAPDSRAAYFTAGQVFLPTDGSGGVGVDSRAASVNGGSVGVASTLAVSFGSSADPMTYSGSSAGRAQFGNLGVRADGTYTGSTSSLVVDGSQAFGLATDTMTFNGSTGAGTYQPHLTIDGSLFGVGRDYSELSFFYSVNNGPASLAFRILNVYGTLTYYGTGGYTALPPGFTMTGDAVNGFTVAGSTTFTPDIPLTFGTAEDVTFGLWASVLPVSSQGLLVPSGGDVEFMSTVKLTGIDVLDSNGRPLDDVSIASGSGTVYDRNGVETVSAVPEPSEAALLFVGLVVFGAQATRKMRLRRLQGGE
jgi:hypothetical protein